MCSNFQLEHIEAPLPSIARSLFAVGWCRAKCLASAGPQIQLHDCPHGSPSAAERNFLHNKLFRFLQTGKGLAAPPPFTLADIKNAIPAHCWKKNAWRSMSYLARDVAIVVGMAAAAYSINSWCLPVPTPDNFLGATTCAAVPHS